jgi:hypothetical protein
MDIITSPSPIPKPAEPKSRKAHSGKTTPLQSDARVGVQLLFNGDAAPVPHGNRFNFGRRVACVWGGGSGPVAWQTVQATSHTRPHD